MKYCSAPYEIVNIHEHGNVKFCLCPSWAHSPANLLGNYHDDVSLSELFASAPAQRFRQSITDQSYEFCYRNRCPNIHNLEEVADFASIQAPKLPTWVILNLDENCNLRCGSCRDHLIWTKAPNHRADKILNKLMAEYQDYPEIVRIRADGSGDVFVSESYRNFFLNAQLPECFRFEVITNGNLITKNLDVLDKLGPQLRSVTITFDAATPETYKTVRGGKFQLIIDGVNALVSRDITVTSTFVAQHDNYQELLQYRDLAQSLGITCVGASIIQRWPHQTDTYWAQHRLSENPNVDYDWLKSALQIFKSDGNCEIDGGLEKLLLDLQGISIAGPIWAGT